VRSEAVGARFPPSAIVLVGALGALAVSVVSDASPLLVALLVIVVAAVAISHRTLLRWHSLLAAILLVLLFIPAKRYTLPAGLPFKLDVYRALVAAVIVCWGASLLVDPRVRLRRSAFDAPLVLLVAAVLASVSANGDRVQPLGSDVAKSLLLLLGFVAVYYFTVSVVAGRRHVELMLKLLVGGAALVAIASVVERRTAYNVFDHLGEWVPFLDYHGYRFGTRGGRLRVLASSSHPIALGALFAMLLPISVALGYRLGRHWWILAGALGVGVFATASRTPVLMLAAAGAILLWLKPEVKRLWPLAVPAAVVVHFLLPGAIGTIRDAFLPAGGLVAEQSNVDPEVDPLLAGGRLRLLGPSLDEWAQRPLFGQGEGTRITGFEAPNRNAPILDNEWLGTLLELGVLGFAAWAWLLLRAVRRLGARARDAPAEEGWLFAGLAASVAAFGVGMFTYDAFSFIQVTFVFWILLGLASSLLASPKHVPGAAP